MLGGGWRAQWAARLIQAATDGILCDEAVDHAAPSHVASDPLPPIMVKGKAKPVAVYRPQGGKNQAGRTIDQMSPAQQLTLRVASTRCYSPNGVNCTGLWRNGTSAPAPDDLSLHYPLLARPWRRAEGAAKAIYYLEKAGEQARLNRAVQEALRYLSH